MGNVEKTVFISYRRKDISWALLVYKHLTASGFDVFFDYISIAGGDFEQIIISNIKARAHFIIILTPSTLDRCNRPGDWLRREIETAIDEKRNIIPLFFDGFSFKDPAISKKLTGKLSNLKKYNGLEVPAGYFDAAMEKLQNRYLNASLDTVLHPLSNEVIKVVEEQKDAADKAIIKKNRSIILIDLFGRAYTRVSKKVLVIIVFIGILAIVLWGRDIWLSPVSTPGTPTPSAISTTEISPAPACQDIQVSHLELDLATGPNQKRIPDAQSTIHLKPGEVRNLAKLSGEAILTGANVGQCKCIWVGNTNLDDFLKPIGSNIRCGFSIDISDQVSTINLKLSTDKQEELFIIRINQE